MGSPCYRFVCDQTIQSCSSLCEPICKRYRGGLHRRIHPRLELRDSMGFPSARTHAQSPSSSQCSQGDVYCNRPTVAPGVLVPGSSEESSGITNKNSGLTSELDRSNHQSTSTECGAAAFGGLEASGWLHYIRGWSDVDVKLLEKAWRPSTLKTYSTAWKRWTEWAKNESIDINEPKPEDVALFLSFLHRVKGLSSSTILVNKSVITSFADPVRAEAISNHPIVKQMLKAISISRVSEKRPIIWDVQKLLDWLKTNTPDEDSIYQISRHLAILLLLASGRRVHDLTLLSVEKGHYQRLGNCVVLWPKFGSKTDKAACRQTGWKVRENSEPSIDILYWLDRLIMVSKKRRGTRESLDCLFISTRGKVRPASRAMIAGWVKTALRELGIETGAGSVRSAVGSARFYADLQLDEILLKGNWKNATTFLKYYCKPIDRSSIDEVQPQSDSPLTCFEAV
nr:unnamed protein product [Callosobruchus analis]